MTSPKVYNVKKNKSSSPDYLDKIKPPFAKFGKHPNKKHVSSHPTHFTVKPGEYHGTHLHQTELDQNEDQAPSW